jgi:hypothetical protein
MDHAVSRCPLTAKLWFNPWPVCVEFMVHKTALGRVFLRAFQFYPLSIFHYYLLSFGVTTQ